MKSNRILLALVATSLAFARLIDSQAATVEVRIENFSFVPDPANIQVGDTIRWTQLDNAPHTSTSGASGQSDGLWDSGLMSLNQTFTHTFSEAGSFPYYCIPHRTFMFGTVNVTGVENTRPTVSLTNPDEGTVFPADEPILIQAIAEDSDGAIERVEFFDGELSLGVVDVSPFEVTVNLSGGEHLLTAQAEDDQGGVTTSDPIRILVRGSPIGDPIEARIPKGTITVEVETIAVDLSSPLGMATLDDGTGRSLVYDQSGLVWLLTIDGVQPAPVLDVRDRLVTLGVYDERGLLGLAAHPDFSQNSKVYTYTSEPSDGPADFTSSANGEHNHQSVVAEWNIDSTDPDRVDPATRRELLRIDQPQSNHNGGTLRFGPDGYLYVALGDGGAADDQGDGHLPEGNARNPNNIYGSLLRIDVDGTDAANGQYGIPGDNPLIGGNGLDEIFAYGLRNPFSFSFDRSTGEIYLADVGQNKIEEVDLIVAEGNYGWNTKEGTFYFDPNGESAGFVTDIPVGEVSPDLIDPIAQYDHDDGSAVVGGFIYRGTELPELSGVYVFGDWGSFGRPSGRLFFLDQDNEVKEFRIGLDDRPLGDWIKGFGEGPDGELYVLTSRTLGPIGDTGAILKLVPPPAPLFASGSVSSPVDGLTLEWSGGEGPFAIQQKLHLADPVWSATDYTAGTSVLTDTKGGTGFVRIADTAKQPAIPLTAHLSREGAGALTAPETAGGSGSFRLEGNTLRFEIEYHGLSGPAGAAHIHGPATTTESAGVLISLVPFNGGSFGLSGTLSGAVPLTSAQKALILGGLTYVNVHTAANSGGEIRGQIAPVLMTAVLSGEAQANPVDTPGNGLGLFALTGNRLTLNITYRDLSAPATLAHIHGPAPAFTPAGVLVDLAPFNGGAFNRSGSLAGSVNLTPSQLSAIIDGQTYVNLHTANNPGGEIRGQIVPQAAAVPLSAKLTPEAAGVEDAPEGAEGSAILSLEGNELAFSIRYQGLSGPAGAAHIHGPASTTGSAGVLINLAPFNGGAFDSAGTLAGLVVLTASQKQLILTGQTYLNVHTAAHSGGEIRGQIAPLLMTAYLAGANERPTAVPTSATGSGLLTLVGNELRLNVTYQGLTGPATGSHIHGPASLFQSAGVLANLGDLNGGTFGTGGSLSGTVTLTTEQTAAVIDERSYLNFHTDTYNAGEIRGQIAR